MSRGYTAHTCLSPCCGTSQEDSSLEGNREKTRRTFHTTIPEKGETSENTHDGKGRHFESELPMKFSSNKLLLGIKE